MFHLEEQDQDGFDDDDLRLALLLERQALMEERFGPTEDSHERTAPYLDLLPEESEHEEGSPLDFGGDDFSSKGDMVIDDQIRQAYAQGISLDREDVLDRVRTLGYSAKRRGAFRF